MYTNEKDKHAHNIGKGTHKYTLKHLKKVNDRNSRQSQLDANKRTLARKVYLVQPLFSKTIGRVFLRGRIDGTCHRAAANVKLTQKEE